MIANGFICVDKPQGLSSFDVVRIARKALGIKKIGHCGTLDPQASGVLVLALGHATRLISYLHLEPKEYQFSIQFGKMTDTLDYEGEVTIKDYPVPSRETLTMSIQKFLGLSLQVPPQYSAVKINGVRAYTLARQKIPVSIPSREVTLHTLELVSYDEELGVAHLQTQCSAGTYIRSLCRDIAEKAGTVGIASFIRRSKAGGFTVQDAVSVEDIVQKKAECVRTVFTELSSMPNCIIHDTDTLNDLKHGRQITVQHDAAILFIFDNDKNILAVAKQVSHDRYRPLKVFLQQ